MRDMRLSRRGVIRMAGVVRRPPVCSERSAASGNDAETRRRRGSHRQPPHPTLTSNARFLNYFRLGEIETISPRPMMFVAGDQAHSLEFSQDAYQRANEPKELVLVAGAT